MDHKTYQMIKRLLDLTICLLVLPWFLIGSAVIAIAIILDSSGNPFFIQERIGKDSRPFKMYKFRTLQLNRDSSADRVFMQAFIVGQSGLKDDSGEVTTLFKPIKTQEITRVGCLLRKSSLDELPQLFNVLRGEMSLVGPRPNVSWEVEKYLEWHCERLKVLPGITGLAQVRGRSSLTFDAIAAYDIEYVRNQSLRLDLWILWRTVIAVFSGNGAG